MSNSETMAGQGSYLLYAKESTFNTPVTPNLHLGIVTSYKPSISNNMVAHRGFAGLSGDARNIVNFTPGKLDVSASVDFKVIRWDFLEFVLGAASGGSPNTFSEAALPPSATISSNIVNQGSSATNQKLTISGTVFDACTIRCATGDEVKASIDFKGALPVLATSVDTNITLPNQTTFNFTGGAIELPSGSTLNNIIDSIDVTVKNGFEQFYGIGTRLSKAAKAKERDYSIKVTLKYLDNALLTAALGATTPTATGGPTTYATFKLTFALGARSLVWTFTGIPLDQFNQIHEVNTLIGEDLTFTPSASTAVYTP